MAKRIVYVFKTIQVKKQNGQLIFISL